MTNNNTNGGAINSNEALSFIEFIDKYQQYFMTAFRFLEDRESNDHVYPNVKIIKKAKDLDVSIDVSNVKYPYFQLRGKPVSKEQAYDIIARTDIEFKCLEYRAYTDEKIDTDAMLYLKHFSNNWFSHNQFPFLVGWCHPDGTIGVNDTGHKYPDFDEVLLDLVQIVNAFPYLEFVIAFTTWYELSPTCQERFDNDKIKESFEEFQRKQVEIANQELEAGVVMGYYIHDSIIEIIDKEDAYRLLNEYKEKYGKDEIVYHDLYYGELVPSPITYDMLNSCINAISDEAFRKYVRKHMNKDLEQLKVEVNL